MSDDASIDSRSSRYREIFRSAVRDAFAFTGPILVSSMALQSKNPYLAGIGVGASALMICARFLPSSGGKRFSEYASENLKILAAFAVAATAAGGVAATFTHQTPTTVSAAHTQPSK